MFICVSQQISLGGPAKQATNGSVWTGSAQIGLLYGTLFFFLPPTHFLCCEMTMLPFFPHHFFFLMSSHKHPELPYCFQRGDSVSSFETSYNKQKTNYGLSGITVEYEDKRDMMQCSFYNWFRSTVHSIMVYRKPITTNCSSKHEHLARNDSMSFTLYHVSRNAACFMLQPCNEFTAQRPSLL